METLNFAIPTLFGLEALAADELRRLGLDQVRAENGRVLCSGRPGDIPRMDLNLRTGERVLLVLGTFPAGDFDALFEGTRALPWEQFIPREGRFPVKGHCLNSALHSVPACQSIVKKAAAARLGDAYGLNTLPETGALFQIQFSIMKDTAVLMLDTSGPGLYKRGYRAHGVDAPLRETLAAAMVMPGLRAFKAQLDPNKVGGTAFIGISRPVIKAHGSSNAEAIENAMGQAGQGAESGIIGQIQENVHLMQVQPE